MPGPYVIRGSVVLPEAELAWRFSRSSGPGGQHVNTSDSRVELLFDVAATKRCRTCGRNGRWNGWRPGWWTGW